MFCENCGKELQDEWRVCPYCGYEEKKAIDAKAQGDAVGQEYVEAQAHKRTGFEDGVVNIGREQENKESIQEYHLIGIRRNGRFSFARISTDIQVQGNDFYVRIDNGKKEDVHFHKREVVGIDFPMLPIWTLSSKVAVVLFVLLMAFTYGMSIFGAIFYIKIAMVRHVRIKLNTGHIVKIPIRQKADASDFLKELSYSKIEIAKNDNKRISEASWFRREWISSMLLLALAAGTITWGFEKQDFSGWLEQVRISDEFLRMVKEGSPDQYQDKTYEEAFDAFLEILEWRSFVGILNGPDEDEDGEPDYTQDNVYVVEFAGRCSYKDKDWVACQIQFAMDKEEGVFEPVSVSLDGVQQNSKMIQEVLYAAFTFE